MIRRTGSCSDFQKLWNIRGKFLCFVDHAPLYNLLQMKPTRCTLLLSIFISTSVHVSGNYVPVIRRTYCIYATLVFSVWSAISTSLHVSGNHVPIIRRTYCIYATLVFSVWSVISTFLHVSGNYVPTIRRAYCIYATLVFFVLYGWLSALLAGMSPSQPADQTATRTE